MIPELGLFCLIVAFVLTFLQASTLFFLFIPKEKAQNLGFIWPHILTLNRYWVLGQSLFITLSVLVLVYAFASNDFSVAYVAAHSNSALPFHYKIAAFWGGHEGSLLLWVLLLACWSLSVMFDSRPVSPDFKTTVLSILGLMSFGFLAFILFSSNPFHRFLPDFPLEGRDLNPLLQDPAFVLHPPLLYIGYVGLAIPFAVAVAILGLRLRKKFKENMKAQRHSEQPLTLQKPEFDQETDLSRLTWTKPYILVALGFLSIGVAWGSYWAYYELGWGGWWFWDPVENASFMPWLISVALLHSMIVTDKRKQLGAFTLLLCLLGFAFSLLGTFLVRSGIITSVHAFASDPGRGIFLLQLILVFVGGAFILYAWAAKGISISGQQHSLKSFLFSRESFILFSAMLLTVASFSILLGTIYGIIFETFTGQKMSIGFPYFNMVFIPLMIPILFLLPLGPFMKWGENRFRDLLKPFRKVVAGVGIFLSLFSVWLFFYSKDLDNLFLGPPSSLILKYAKVFLGLTLALWVCLGTLERVLVKMRGQGFKGLSLGGWGMAMAHFGVGILVLGITVVTQFEIERELVLSPKQRVLLAGYTIDFEEIQGSEGSNYIGFKGKFVIKRKNKIISELFPEKRTYVMSRNTLSETAIDAGFFRDIYITLGEHLEGEFWSVKLYYKPFVRWIWAGALMIALGAFLAALKKEKGKKP